MKQSYFDLLACPECRAETLTVLASHSQGDEVITGEIACDSCGRIYAIRDGIPFFVTNSIADLIDEGDLSPDGVIQLSKESEATAVTAANILYHDQIADSYERDASTTGMFEEGKGSQKRIAEVIDLLKRRTPGQVFLDVGCGSGNVMHQAQRHFAKCIGIDVSVGMLSLAYKKGLAVLLGDAAKIPLKPDSVDAISCFSVLHHLLDQKPLFAECARILKPGGYLYTDWDPNALYVGQNPKERSSLYSLALAVFRKWVDLALRLRGKTNAQSNATLQKVAELAEYHYQISPGLDPYHLREHLIDCGFADVQIVFHRNADSLTPNRKMERIWRCWAALKLLLNLRFEYPSSERSMRYFLMLAQR